MLHYHPVLEISWDWLPGKGIFHFYCLTVSYLCEIYTGKVASNVYCKGYRAPSLVMDAVKNIFSFSGYLCAQVLSDTFLETLSTSITRPQDLPQDKLSPLSQFLKQFGAHCLWLPVLSRTSLLRRCVMFTTGRAEYVHTGKQFSWHFQSKSKRKTP